MKSLPIIALLSAAAAFVFAPISFEVACSILFTLAVGSIVTVDYSRRARLIEARFIDVSNPRPHRSHLRLAA